jgi:hypothetical protein
MFGGGYRLFGDAIQQTNSPFSYSNPPPSPLQAQVDSMSREELAAELRLAHQQGQFQTMGARIKHEAYIARLKARLAKLTDPRIEKIMAALKHVELGVHDMMAGDELKNLKMKMQALSPDELEELFYVFENVGIQRVVDILMAEYR